MHDNDGQVTPVSQAFSVWTLEGLSTRTGELEALLELVSDYGEFKGETGNALAAILRLIHELQDETVKAIALYKQAPGAIGYVNTQVSQQEQGVINLFRLLDEKQKGCFVGILERLGGEA